MRASIHPFWTFLVREIQEGSCRTGCFNSFSGRADPKCSRKSHDFESPGEKSGITFLNFKTWQLCHPTFFSDLPLQGKNHISHLWNRNILSYRLPFKGDMLAPMEGKFSPPKCRGTKSWGFLIKSWDMNLIGFPYHPLLLWDWKDHPSSG